MATGVATALWASTATPVQADWTAPQKVSAIGPETSDAQVAVDAAGDITVVWKNGFAEGSIGSAFRPAGGDWQPPVTPISTSTCHDPKLAVNASGAAVVVADCGTGTTKMKAAYRSTAGGSWGSSADIPGSESGKEPRVGIDDAGNATVVWAKETDGTVQSSYKPAAGVWAATPKQVSTADATSVPQIAVSPSGIETAIWLHEVSASITAVESKDRTGSGEWGAVKTLTKGLPANPVALWEPQVTWNANGQRLAAWALDGSPVGILQSHWGGVGSWSEEISIKGASDGATDVEEPRIAIDGQGRAVAIWRSGSSGGFYPQFSTTSSLDGSWSSPVFLSNVVMGGFPGTEPQIAIDPAGDATAVWPVIGGAVYSASRPAGGAFGPAAQIPGASTASSDPPQVTMDPGGDAFAVWVSTETRFVMEDNTPPALSAISVPVSGKTGVAAAMSATGSDSWSSPVTVHWDFGDGTSANGAAVSHAYASPGTKIVTVSATDAAGNTSASQTRQIVVTGSLEPNPPVKLSIQVPKQTWKAIAKAKAVKLECGLDAAGSCRASASLSGSVAKRLGLSAGKRVKVGSGSVAIPRAGRLAVLTVKLTAKARAAIAAATRNVPLQLEITGSAPGRVKAAKTRTLTIKRP